MKKMTKVMHIIFDFVIRISTFKIFFVALGTSDAVTCPFFDGGNNNEVILKVYRIFARKISK